MLKLIFLLSLTFITIITSSDSLKNIDINNFDSEVKKSNEVWVLEIGSKMCGSCAEFLPEFESVANEMKSVNFGVTNIDNQNGMKLVNSFAGVLNEGVPSALIVYKQNGDWSFVTAGKGMPRDQLKKLITTMTKNLKLSNGKYLRKAQNEDL